MGGEIEFTALLYVPATRPFAKMGDDEEGRMNRVKLYVRRVMVAEGKDSDILPKWLNFVEGIVDSDDLPLNVNREQLQQNKILKVIRKKCVRKILELCGRRASSTTRTRRTLATRTATRRTSACPRTRTSGR